MFRDPLRYLDLPIGRHRTYRKITHAPLAKIGAGWGVISDFYCCNTKKCRVWFLLGEKKMPCPVCLALVGLGDQIGTGSLEQCSSCTTLYIEMDMIFGLVYFVFSHVRLYEGWTVCAWLDRHGGLLKGSRVAWNRIDSTAIKSPMLFIRWHHQVTSGLGVEDSASERHNAQRESRLYLLGLERHPYIVPKSSYY